MFISGGTNEELVIRFFGLGDCGNIKFLDCVKYESLGGGVGEYFSSCNNVTLFCKTDP